MEHRMRVAGWSRRKPLRIWLNPAHGPALLRLAEQIDADAQLLPGAEIRRLLASVPAAT